MSRKVDESEMTEFGPMPIKEYVISATPPNPYPQACLNPDCINEVVDLKIDIEKLKADLEKCKDALEFCKFDDRYIGTFSCKVSALKAIRKRVKQTLKELEGE